jgi:adenosine deaminase
MQDEEALERVTYELVVDKAADRVAYLEIKWAPALHTAGGLSLDNVIQAVCRGMRAGSRASGAVATATCVAVRSHTPKLNLQVAEAAARFSSDGVTGFDLAGLEAEFPDPLIHAHAFAVAREADLGITLHAGELDDEGAAVWRALELRPSRIAHGATAVHDPGLQAVLVERGVTLDLCPTSNVQAGTVADIGSHPLAHLLRAGVPVTVSTDDVTISDVTLSEEFENSHSAIGLTLPELWRANLHALDVAFVDDASRRELRERFETWADPIPELQG